MLAALPDPLPGLRPLSKDQLRNELAAARRRGYVVSHGERFQGAVGVSGPVRDATGRVVGDLVISWPDNRTSPEKERSLGEAARDAADEVSRGLGWDGVVPREG